MKNLKLFTVLFITSSLFGQTDTIDKEVLVIKSEPIVKKTIKREPYLDCAYVEKTEVEQNKKEEIIKEKDLGVIDFIETSLKVISDPMKKVVVEENKDNMVLLQKEECVTKYKEQEKNEIQGYKNFFIYEGKKYIKIDEKRLSKVKINIKIQY